MNNDAFIYHLMACKRIHTPIRVSTMSKHTRFNPAREYGVIVAPISKINERNYNRALKRLARFLNVDPTTEDVSMFAELFGLAMVTSTHYVSLVNEQSEYYAIALETPSIFEHAIEADWKTEHITIIT